MYGFNSNQYNNTPGYSQIVSLILHLSQLKSHKISDQKLFHQLDCLVCRTNYPHTFIHLWEERICKVNLYSLDNLSSFVVNVTYVLQDFRDNNLFLENIGTSRLIKIFVKIVESESYYASTVMFAMIYELLQLLNHTSKLPIITFVMDNFDTFFLHWYYQARQFFFSVIQLRLTYAPSFRLLNNNLLNEEVEFYDKYGDLKYEKEIATKIQKKIKFYRDAQKGGEKELKKIPRRSKVYLTQAIKEFDELNDDLTQWQQKNTLQCPKFHLDLDSVSNIENNFV